MKTKIARRIMIGCAAMVATIAQLFAADLSALEKIERLHVFALPVGWIGTPPTMNESEELLSGLKEFESSGVQGGLTALEKFLTEHPDSAWAPSLRVNLAEYYREHGRYSLALEHWEKAWQATRLSNNLDGKKLAVRAFAGWTRLLASIGEKEKLKPLFAELASLRLPLGSYSTMIEETQEGVIAMGAKPQISYRCGSYALANVALALHMSSSASSNLFAADSPANGFEMGQLLSLGELNGLSMEAVRRPAKEKIIVPSVVHWKLNHYAAIVDAKNGRYKIIDPTFRGHVWMDMETIDSETSGAFLVPKTNAPVQWAKLSMTECASIRGKGVPNEFEDSDDDGPCDCPPCDDDQDDDGSDPPAANDGTGDGSSTNSQCGDVGMPVWRASEPYMTLWLSDTPLLYRKSNGKWEKLQLRYKHRGEDKGSSIGGFGPNWECDFIGFLQQSTATPDVYSHHAPGGGIKPYDSAGSPNYKSMRTFSMGNLHSGGGSSLPGGGGGGGAITSGSAPRLSRASAANTSFQYSAPAGVGLVNYFPTHRVDRHGRTSFLNYENIGSLNRITNAVDHDGRAFVFSYTNTAFPHLITKVTDPYNRSASFIYDSNGLLTNIIDMAGMASAFQYDDSYRITNMITSYGTNSFEYFSGVSTNYTYNGDPTIRRALLITEASGDKQLYAYCDDGPAAAAADGYVHYRNSYHWNRAQYAAISSTGKSFVLDMPDSDYAIASSKHWFHGNNNTNGMMTVSDTLSTSAEPVNANGNRPQVYFGYTGAPIGSAFIGTQKRVTECQTGLGQSYSIQRNSLGRPEVMTYHKANQTANYTNNYDVSGQNLLTVFGPRGERIRAYGYHPVLTNLLVAVTNAENEVIRYTHNTNTLKVTSTTLPSGLVRSNLYFGSGTYQGFLSTQIELGIRTNYFGYLSGNLAAQTNELGLVTTYLYDNLNRLVSTTFPDTTTISNVYDKLDLVATKDRLNQWTRYGYNNVRQLMAVTNAADQVTTYDYCSCGAPSQITRWNGTTPVITTFSYDLAGNLTNVVYPDGYELNYTYNDAGLVETVTDAAAHQLHLYYTQLGTKPAVYQATLGGQTLFTHTFDEYGRIVQTVDRNYVTVTNGYDFLDRLVARRTIGNSGYGPDQTGLETFTYNTNGLASYSDALGQITRYVRDVAGRVLYETNANTEVLGFTYTPADQLLTLTDGKNQTTRWNYDTYGRVTNKVDAAMNTLFVYKYDPLDRLTNRWSAAKSNTIYKYDAIGNLTNVVYASGTTPNIVLRYDGLNRLTNMVDAAGTTVFGWTLGNQLASEDGPWASDTLNYNYTSRQRSALSLAQPNASDWVQGYGYDQYMRLTNVLSAAGGFDYNYYSSASDRVQYLVLPNRQGPWYAYIYNQYDGLMRVTGTQVYTPVGLGNAHGYSYNEGNQRTQQVFTVDGAGQYNYVNYTYDNIGQLQSARGYDRGYDPDLYDYVETPRKQEQFGYGYDAAWNLQYRTNNALVQTFNVDNRNQLTSATRTGTMTVTGTATERKGGYYGWSNPSGVTNVTVSGTGLSSGAAELYTDGSWARAGATLADGNNSYTASAEDTYGRTATDSVAVNLPATNTFVYDLNGNLRTNSTRIFDYDDENQLIRITEPSAWKSEFTYDGFMRRRIRKEYTWSGGTWVKTNEMRYVYDGKLVVQERDANNLPLITYTRGDDLSGSLEGAGGIGGLLARTDNGKLTISDPGANAYYHCDGNGNVTALVNTNGAIMARYSYDPYGNILSISGPLAAANTYCFSSKELHVNSGLIYYLYRYYSPNVQRWINRDPIHERGGLNLYRFTKNNPASIVDSLGLNCKMWFDNYGNYHMGEAPPQPDAGGITDLSTSFGTLMVAANPAARAGGSVFGALSRPAVNGFYRASAFASKYPHIVEAGIPVAILASEKIFGAEWPVSLPDPGIDSKITLLDKGWEASQEIGEKMQETIDELQAYLNSHKSPDPNPMWGIGCSNCKLNQPVIDIPKSTCQ